MKHNCVLMSRDKSAALSSRCRDSALTFLVLGLWLTGETDGLYSYLEVLKLWTDKKFFITKQLTMKFGESLNYKDYHFSNGLLYKT